MNNYNNNKIIIIFNIIIIINVINGENPNDYLKAGPHNITVVKNQNQKLVKVSVDKKSSDDMMQQVMKQEQNIIPGSPQFHSGRLKLELTSKWRDGFCLRIHIFNPTHYTSRWSVSFKLPSATMTSSWNCILRKHDHKGIEEEKGYFIFFNHVWNGRIPPLTAYKGVGMCASGKPSLINVNATFFFDQKAHELHDIKIKGVPEHSNQVPRHLEAKFHSNHTQVDLKPISKTITNLPPIHTLHSTSSASSLSNNISTITLLIIMSFYCIL